MPSAVNTRCSGVPSASSRLCASSASDAPLGIGPSSTAPGVAAEGDGTSLCPLLDLSSAWPPRVSGPGMEGRRGVA